VLVIITNNNMNQSPNICNIGVSKKMCNVLKSNDCIQVNNGCARVDLGQDETKVYV